MTILYPREARSVLLPLAVLAVLLYPATPSVAVEVLSAEELESHCRVLPEDSEGADGQYCIRYVQGFIDGAVATDVRVMLNVEQELARQESLTQRAQRVRGRDLRRAAGYAEFCLGDPVPLREVVDHVAGDLSAAELPPELSARQFVYAVLRNRYPCD